MKLLKPRLDDRFGAEMIRSRSGLEAEADLLLDPDVQIEPAIFQGVDCVLVDEAQFLLEHQIEALRAITISPGVPVICYGLRTDFQTRLFPGSRRLLELADSIEEVKVTCQYCGRKAVFNLRLVGGVAATEGPQIMLGADDEYVPVCPAHYFELTSEAAGK